MARLDPHQIVQPQASGALGLAAAKPTAHPTAKAAIQRATRRAGSAYERRAMVVAALFFVVAVILMAGLVLGSHVFSGWLSAAHTALFVLAGAAAIAAPVSIFGCVFACRSHRARQGLRAEVVDLQAVISGRIGEAGRREQSILAGMNHALRTPLNGIMGLSDALRNQMLGPLSQDQHARYCADIYDAAEELRRVIAESFGAVDAGRAAGGLDLDAKFGLPGWPGPVRLSGAAGPGGVPTGRERFMIEDEGQIERLSVLAKEFVPAALEFHRRAMGKEGYALAGPVVRHRYAVLEGPARRTALLDGVEHYTATFVRRR